MNSLRRSPSSRKVTPYSPNRLALTGATGSLGRHFLEIILEEMPQVHVTAMVRTSSDNFRSADFQALLRTHAERVTIIDADLRDGRLAPVAQRQMLETDGGLWHFAASTNLHAASPAAHQQIRDINHGGTASLLSMLAASDCPGPFYYVSTAYVCGKRTGRILEGDLAHDEGFRNTYEGSKYAAETLVRNALNNGLSGSVFRPSLVVCDNPGTGPAHIADVLVNAFRQAAHHRMPLSLRISPDVAINAVNDEWAIRALFALAPFAAEKRTYHLTGRTDVSMAAFASAALQIFDGLNIRLLESGDAASGKIGDRLAERMLAPFKPYFDASVQFDRTNLETDAPECIEGAELDPLALLRSRATQKRNREIA